MRAKILESKVGHSNASYRGSIYTIPTAEHEQNLVAYGDGIEFEIRMKSTKGFHFPLGGELDLEIKFTHIPEKPTPRTTVIK
jgi:hypothetical protein